MGVSVGSEGSVFFRKKVDVDLSLDLEKHRGKFGDASYYRD
jgi:hypothetical protein